MHSSHRLILIGPNPSKADFATALKYFEQRPFLFWSPILEKMLWEKERESLKTLVLGNRSRCFRELLNASSNNRPVFYIGLPFFFFFFGRHSWKKQTKLQEFQFELLQNLYLSHSWKTFKISWVHHKGEKSR